MRRRKAWSSSLVAIGIVAALAQATPASGTASALAGGLDPSFATGGVYRLDMTEPSLDVANAAIIGRAGDVVAGTAGGRFALAAFDHDSVPFNNGYKQLIVDFGRPSAAHGLIEYDNRLTAVGSAGNDFAVATLHFDGDPDFRFGDQGRVRTSFGAPAVAYGVAAMSGLKRLAVGTVRSGEGGSVAMARYDDQGRLDPSFGTGGRLVADITPGADSADAVVETYSAIVGERFLVAGQAGPDVLIAKFLADGSPDATFGTGGRVVLGLTPGDDVAHALSVDGDGRVLVAGSANTEAFVARLSPAGVLDPGFGDGGVVRTTFGGTAARLKTVRWDLAIDEVQASGTVTGPGGDDAVVARFLADGTADPDFGAGGRAVIDLGGPADQANAVIKHWRGDGRVFLRVVGSDGADMVAESVDYWTGLPPYGPDYSDRQAIDFGRPTSENAGGAAVLADGRIVVAGSGTRGIILVRLLPDGSPDPSFGTAGVSVTSVFADVAAVAIVDGRIMVLGHRDYVHGGSGVFRFYADGILDQSYAEHGFAFTGINVAVVAPAMAVLPDGGMVVGGGGEVVKLTPSGAIANRLSLGQDSDVVGVAAQPDGKFVALYRNYRDRIGAGLTRFNADATLDGTFHNSTWLTLSPVVADPSSLLRLADGRFVVGARTSTLYGQGSEPADLVLAGFTADGAVDQAFGSGGATRTAVADLDKVVALAEQADGTIVSVHRQTGDPPRDSAGVARYLPDGRLDGMTTVTAVHPSAAALTGPGHVIVAGRAGEGWDLAVARVMSPDGTATGSYHPLAPARLLDTRSGLGGPAAKLGPASSLQLQVAGRGGVPAGGASAVVLNITVTDAGVGSFLTAWPAGQPRPLASNLNFGPGETVANLVVVKVGDGGGVSLYNHGGTTHVVADVAGWYRSGDPAGARYSTLTPARVLDTRAGLGAPAVKVGPGSTIGLVATGRGGVPATGVSAVVLNVTATEPTAGSFLTAWPAGAVRPVASNLNYSAGQTVPNLVVVKVGTGGVVNLYNLAGSVHLVADVAGWFGVEGAGAGALYSPAVPSRILDTRNALGAPAAKVGPASGLTVQVTGRGGVPSAGVTAVILNVTATEPTVSSFLTVWPAGEARPVASNLNLAPGQTRPNLVVVKVGEGGKVNVYNHSGSVHVIADVAGWYDS